MMLPFPDAWPPLERLPRFQSLLGRLEALPERVGPIDLGVLRDTALPWPSTWPPTPPTAAPPPERPDPNWLAGALTGANPAEHPAATLLRIARQLRPLPGWTLATMWLLEVALAWPVPPGPRLGTLVQAELGDLYCQSGDIVGGLELLDAAADTLGPDGREHALRAARWVELLHGGVAADRLARLQGADAPEVVRLQAELELLGLGPASDPGADLLERARRVDELVDRTAALPLSPADRHSLHVRGQQIVARWFNTSRVRPIREEGRKRLLLALEQCAAAGDQRGRSQLLDLLGRAHLRLGAVRQARQAFEESIALKQPFRDLWGLGGAMTGTAECLLAAGQALEALPYFRVNLLLIDRLGGVEVLFVRNLARHLNALIAAGCSPLDNTAPPVEVLELAVQLRHEFTAVLPAPENDPFWLLLDGGYRRLAARRAEEAPAWQEHLRIGLAQVERARELFLAQGLGQNTAEADRSLAALLLDRASLATELLHLPDKPAGVEAGDLDRAREALEEADRQAQGQQTRVQAELLWARYHQLAGNPYQMQLHLAAARRAAEASGFQALAVEVDARLGVRLTGPGGAVESATVVALPGETVPLEIRASDWRGRPLPGYVLHGFVEAKTGPCPAVAGSPQCTDHLGRARFELQAGGAARAVFHAATPDGVHTASVPIVVRCVELEWPASQGLAEPLTPGQARLLRQLFGPGCPRVRVQREFTSGRSGTRVLLVEPFRDGEQGEELRGQPCIVKMGPKSLLEDELDRYLRWVKELLPVNVSRLDGFASWQDEAALRQSLVAGLARGQVREAREWLAGAEAFDAHLLLERVFVGDLPACWYANNPRINGPLPLAELYGPMVPCLLELEDDRPPRGLTGAGTADGASARVEDGLRPPAARSFQTGQEVVVGGTSVLGFRGHNGTWEYELRTDRLPLRLQFRSSLPPDLVEPDGAPERLLQGGRLWTVRGRVRATAYDRLHENLTRCCAAFGETHPGESVALAPDGRCLLFSAARAFRRLANPLEQLGRLLGQELSCSWSLIHGDLHGRNVLVGAQGQPFYIDFARTGYGPTLFDFVKFEAYLWHENFAGWPAGEGPPGRDLGEAMELLEELASPDPARHFPSPYAHRDVHGRAGWPGLFRQCLATLRSAARPYVVDPLGRDYFLPLAVYTALMLRWCDPAAARDEGQRKVLARQGVFHTLAAASLLEGVLPGVEAK